MHLSTSQPAPLTVSCRFAKVWVSGSPSLFELRINSASDAELGDLRIELRCQGLAAGRAVWHKPEGLRSWQAIDAHPVSCAPRAKGDFPVEVLVRVKTASGHLVGRGTVRPRGHAGIFICKEPTTPSTVNITIQEKAFLGAILQESEVAKIQTYNDLLDVTCTEHFDVVSLEWRDDDAPGLSTLPGHPATVNLPDDLGKWTPITGAAFYLMTTPVSQELWHTVMGKSYGDYVAEKAPDMKGKLDGLFNARLPVVGATFHEALKFCRDYEMHCKTRGFLKEGWAVRLPKISEWELARGPVPSSNLAACCYNLKLHRDLRGLPGQQPRTVDEMLSPGSPVRPLPNGLAGMLGDVFDWCLPSGAAGEGFIVQSTQKVPLMGGSWHPDDLSFCKGTQARRPAGVRSSRVGFRPLLMVRQA